MPARTLRVQRCLGDWTYERKLRSAELHLDRQLRRHSVGLLHPRLAENHQERVVPPGGRQLRGDHANAERLYVQHGRDEADEPGPDAGLDHPDGNVRIRRALPSDERELRRYPYSVVYV